MEVESGELRCVVAVAVAPAVVVVVPVVLVAAAAAAAADNTGFADEMDSAAAAERFA